MTENASRIRRAIAFLVDTWILQMLATPLAHWLAITASDKHETGFISLPGISLHIRPGPFVLLELSLFLAYFLLFECMTRIGSPGKAIFGIILQGAQGSRSVGAGPVILRTVSKVVLFSFWPLLLILLLTTQKSRLPWDSWSGIMVMRKPVLNSVPN
jgi:uncharacterized RDD family membrane protein YckC